MMKKSSKSEVASNFFSMYILFVIVISVHAASAFTLPAWSDIFSSLKPVRNMGSNVDNSRLHELLGRSDDFDELNLMEEGEPRYGLVQLGTGENFNVTLNLSGLILLGLGLSTALLAYMFLDAFKDDGKDSYHSGYGYESYGHDTSGSGGYGHHRKGDFNRKSQRGKLGTGTGFNVTLNLTGHILMAIGIATSLLAYMFLNDMNQEDSYSSGGYSAPSSGYGDRYGRYRSRHFVKKLGTGTGTAYNVTLNLTGHILMAIGISLYLLMYMWFKAMGGYNSGYHYVKRRSFREKLSNSGSAYNVTLNLTGSILLGLGISLALLLYLFQNSMNESSASSGSSGYNDHRRYLRLHKRALDDEEKAVVEMLYRILSSLNEEQVDDVLKQFEKEVIKQASEKQEIFGSQSFGEDCVKQFLCRLFVSDSAMELSRASSKMRVMSLLQEVLNETDNSNNLYSSVSENQNLNNLSLSSYSIYEWNDLIQMILGSKKPLNTKVEDHLFLTKETETNQNDVSDMLKDLYSHFNIIPSKITEYLRVQDFSIGLRKENTEASTTSLQQSCEKRYRKCNLPMS